MENIFDIAHISARMPAENQNSQKSVSGGNGERVFSRPRLTVKVNSDAKNKDPDPAAAIDPNMNLLRITDAEIPMFTESDINAMKFSKNSIEKYISSKLAKNMKKVKANIIAIELGQLINSHFHKNGSTFEDRAVNRKTGLLLAEHFARTSFCCPDAAKAFMEDVKGFAERDELQEECKFIWLGKSFDANTPLSTVFERGETHLSSEAVEVVEANERVVKKSILSAVSKVNDVEVFKTLRRITDNFSML